MHHIGVFYTRVVQMLCQITNINNIIFHAAAIHVVCSRHHIVECGKMRVNANRVLFHVHFFYSCKVELEEELEEELIFRYSRT